MLNNGPPASRAPIDAADYVEHITAAGFVDVAVVDKSDSELDGIAEGPRIYSARVTARKP